MMKENESVIAVLDALSTIRCGAACTEEELHAQVMAALQAAGLPCEHEVRLAPRCRIDFMSGGVGLEIKKSRPVRAKLMTQLARYAACEQVTHLVVAAPRGVDLPPRIGGKSVVMMPLERLWGISLP